MQSRLVIVPIFALAFTDCGGSQDLRQSSREPTRTTAAPVNPYAAGGAAAPRVGDGSTPQRGTTRPQEPPTARPVRVRLLEAGAEPRRKLRYAWKAGKDEWMRFDLKMAVVLAAPGRPAARTESPVLNMFLRMRGEEVLPDGALRANYTLERIDIPFDAKRIAGPADDQLRAETSRLGPIKGRFVIGARGEMKDAELDIPGTIPPLVRDTVESLRDGLKSLFTPLPEEEVGKGARWEVTSRQPMPVWVDVKTIVSLTELDAATSPSVLVRVDAKSDLTAKPGQAVQPPDAPPSVKMTLDSLSGGGTGHTSFALDKLAREGRSSMAVEVRIQARDNGQDITFATTTEIDTSYRPITTLPPRPPARK